MAEVNSQNLSPKMFSIDLKGSGFIMAEEKKNAPPPSYTYLIQFKC